MIRQISRGVLQPNRLLALAAAVVLLCCLWLLWISLRLAANPPGDTAVRGPFSFRVWHADSALRDLVALPLYDRPGLSLRALEPAANTTQPGRQYILQLEAAEGSLREVGRITLPGYRFPLLLDSAGDGLYPNHKLTKVISDKQWQTGFYTGPSNSGTNSQPARTYTLLTPPGGLFTFLPADGGIVCAWKYPDRGRCLVCFVPDNGSNRQIQKLKDITAVGPAWVDEERSLVLLQLRQPKPITFPLKPWKATLFVFDRQTQQFAERPEFQRQAQAIDAKPDDSIWEIALVDDCLSVYAYRYLRLADRSGAVVELKPQYPITTAPSGVRRSLADQLLWNYKSRGMDFRDAAVERGRLDGPHAPADAVSDNFNIVPVNDHELAICDLDYNRLLLVNCAPTRDSGRGY